LRSNFVVFGNNIAPGGRCRCVLIFFDNERHLEIDGVMIEGPQGQEGSYMVPKGYGVAVGCDTLLFRSLHFNTTKRRSGSSCHKFKN